MRVLKWDVPVDDQVHTIGDGRIMHTACQYDVFPAFVQVWTLETNADVDLNQCTRHVRVFGTGHQLPEGIGAGHHIGTALAAGGQLVWHVFQVPAST